MIDIWSVLGLFAIPICSIGIAWWVGVSAKNAGLIRDRVYVYREVRGFLEQTLHNSNLEERQKLLREFRHGEAKELASFLFPSEIQVYLDEVVRREARWHLHNVQAWTAEAAGWVEVLIQLRGQEIAMDAEVTNELQGLHGRFAPYVLPPVLPFLRWHPSTQILRLRRYLEGEAATIERGVHSG